MSTQSAQLTQARNYVEGIELSVQHPRNAPEWTIDPQNVPADTDFSVPNTPAVGDNVEDDENEDELAGGQGEDEGVQEDEGNGE